MGIQDLDCDPAQLCGNSTCPAVFARLRVRPTIRFGTWIEWILAPDLAIPRPYTFQLQVGTAAVSDPDAWVDVGLPADDVSHLVDDEQRVYGSTQWTHYRIKLTGDDASVTYSAPVSAWPDLSPRYARMLQSRERAWWLKLHRTHIGTPGYLLKRKLRANSSDEIVHPGGGVIDFLTEELLDPRSAESVGTEVVGGYYTPIPCINAELMPLSRRERHDPGGQLGMVNDEQRIAANFLAVPQLDSGDVWVQRNSDFRWEIGKITHIEEIQGHPVAVRAEMALLPFDRAVYGLEIDGQVVS